MKRRDKDELRNSTEAGLVKKAAELRKQITEKRLAMQTKEVKNTHEIKELRHKLAVVLSIQRHLALTQKESRGQS